MTQAHPTRTAPEDLLHRLTHLRVNRSSGGPALYKPVTLLWAMARAQRGAERLLSWSETERELGGLLAASGVPPRPHYPVASLSRDGLWSLPGQDDAPTAHGDPRPWFTERRPLGGPTEEVYDLFRNSAVTRLAVQEQLLELYFGDRDPAPLLAELGLPGPEPDAVPGEPEPWERDLGSAAARPERWLLAAAEYEQGCRLLELTEERRHGTRAPAGGSRPKRSRAARLLVLGRSEGRCENPECSGQPAELTDRGLPLLEVDHVRDLALGGRDHPSRMVALCPNCHAVKTRGRSRERLRALLLTVAEERHREMGAGK
ncbi:HNH endonuclease signature motif containing protein [Streptomyces sp. NBC_00566]|uniref:HNH endonuclease signature motif containing protein n=1 Tax=Streptomyces sp. NBC_00566 TaxID=2975778 RepID=UPI002E81DCB7|nr:HNH endonuclease signature motif containing protein [Streptomyces sp. NBC_00566]WUB87126.1 HNH endonuclease [Streptomyces sp. NBC_00566]